MTTPSPLNLLEALQPNASQTSFPVPQLVWPAPGMVSEAFTLAGMRLPGQWLLVSATREFGWQIQAGFFLSGATLLPKGDPIMSIDFDVKIWNSLDAAQYRALLKTVLKKPAFTVPGAAASAAMGHDQVQLSDMGVKSLVVKSVTPLFNPLVASGGKGAWTAKVSFYEYRKPVLAIPAPSQTTPDRAPPAPSANNAAQIEIQNLQATFASKGAQLAQSLSGGPQP